MRGVPGIYRGQYAFRIQGVQQEHFRGQSGSESAQTVGPWQQPGRENARSVRSGTAFSSRRQGWKIYSEVISFPKGFAEQNLAEKIVIDLRVGAWLGWVGKRK